MSKAEIVSDGDKEYNGGILSNVISMASALKNDIATSAIVSWQNMMTGIGFASKDKRIGATVRWNRQTQQEIEHIYAADDKARKIVCKIPKTALKKGINIKAETGNEESVKLFIEEWDRLKVTSKILRAWIWARLYGGAGLFIAADDGAADLSEPLNIENIRQINSLTPLHRWDLHPQELDRDVNSVNFRKPLFYHMSANGSDTHVIIHWTRFIRIDGGEDLPDLLWQSNDRWDDSVLTKAANALRNHNLTHDSVASVMQDFRIGVLRIKNLADLVAAGKTKELKQRVELMNLTKSVMGMVLLDGEDESYENISTSLQNLDKVMGKVDQRLVSATDLPHNLILGDSPNGKLSSTGEGEENQFNDQVQSDRDSVLSDPIDRIFELIQSQTNGPQRGREIPGLTWNFPPIKDPDPKELSEIRKTMAEADERYFNIGALDAEEIAQSRFGGEEFSIETNLDQGMRTPKKDPKIKKNEDADGFMESDHGHFKDGEIIIEQAGTGPNHTHKDVKGQESGPAIELPGGGHFHRWESGGQTFATIPIDMAKRMLSERENMDEFNVMVEHADKIVSKDGKFCVSSKDGKRSFGCFPTETAARRRLKEIEFFKSMSK